MESPGGGDGADKMGYKYQWSMSPWTSGYIALGRHENMCENASGDFLKLRKLCTEIQATRLEDPVNINQSI